MKRFNQLRFFLPLLGFPLLLLRLEETRRGVLEGLRLCGELLIPSLFPFSVLANTLIRMGLAAKLEDRLLVPVSFIPWAMGFLGGFPLGAQTLAGLYREGTMDRQEAIRASCWCGNAGAAFLIGTVGRVLGDPMLGLLLLGIQILTSLLAALLVDPGAQVNHELRKRRDRRAEAPAAAFTGALGDSALAMVRLCGSVCFFLGLWKALEGLLPLETWPDPLRVLVQGAMELSSGTAALVALPGKSAFVIAAGLCGWGGLCVHLQAADALCGEGLPLGPYLAGKLCQALLSGILSFALLRLGLLGGLILSLPVALTGIFFRNRKKRRWKIGNPVL